MAHFELTSILHHMKSWAWCCCFIVTAIESKHAAPANVTVYNSTYLCCMYRAVDEEAQAKGTYIEPVKAVDTMKPWAECNFIEKIAFLATYGTKVDIHDVVEEDPVVAAIHAHAEQFDPTTEYAFSYLQVSCPALHMI
jgi:hypothetical protein